MYTPTAYTPPPKTYAVYEYKPEATTAPASQSDCNSVDPPLICTLALGFGIIVVAGCTIAIIVAICRKKCKTREGQE